MCEMVAKIRTAATMCITQGGGPDNTVPTVTLPVQGPPLRGFTWSQAVRRASRREPRTPLFKNSKTPLATYIFSRVYSM